MTRRGRRRQRVEARDVRPGDVVSIEGLRFVCIDEAATYDGDTITTLSGLCRKTGRRVTRQYRPDQSVQLRRRTP